MSPRRTFTPAFKAAAVARYPEESYADIGRALGVDRKAVRRWAYADTGRPDGRKRPDDGIIDSVAVDRALRFDPAAVAVLRLGEYGEFCDEVNRLFISGRLEQSPVFGAWLALPEADRRNYLGTGAQRARRGKTSERTYL